MSVAELHPCDRFEWERVVRRIVMPKPLKLLALVLATYADRDGSRVRPGQDVLAAVTGDSDRNVRRLLTTLAQTMGLVQMVSRGGGRGGGGSAATYRLTIPVDLLDRVTMLAVDESADVQVSGHSAGSPDTQVSGRKERGQSDSPDTQTSAQFPVDNVVDNSSSPDTQMSGEDDVSEEIDRTSNAVTELMTGHFEAIDRTSRCPTTTRPTTKGDHSDSSDPAQLTTAREDFRGDDNPSRLISECDLCDDTGHIGGWVCTHEPDRGFIRGRSAIQAVLDRAAAKTALTAPTPAAALDAFVAFDFADEARSDATCRCGWTAQTMPIDHVHAEALEHVEGRHVAAGVPA